LPDSKGDTLAIREIEGEYRTEAFIIEADGREIPAVDLEGTLELPIRDRIKVLESSIQALEGARMDKSKKSKTGMRDLLLPSRKQDLERELKELRSIEDNEASRSSLSIQNHRKLGRNNEHTRAQNPENYRQAVKVEIESSDYPAPENPKPLRHPEHHFAEEELMVGERKRKVRFNVPEGSTLMAESVSPKSVATSRFSTDIIQTTVSSSSSGREQDTSAGVMQTAVIQPSGERRQDLPADVMKRVKVAPNPSQLQQENHVNVGNSQGLPADVMQTVVRSNERDRVIPSEIMQTAVIQPSEERRQELPADVMKRVKIAPNSSQLQQENHVSVGNGQELPADVMKRVRITPAPSRNHEIEELVKGLRNAQLYGKEVKNAPNNVPYNTDRKTSGLGYKH